MFCLTLFCELLLTLSFICCNFTLRHGHLPTLTELLKLFQKLFAASRKQKCILVALLIKQLSVLGAVPLVIHVDYNKFIRLVFKPVHFWKHFVSADIGSWKVDCFFNAPQVVILWLS